MNRFALSALIVSACLSGCAADGTQQQGTSDFASSYTPTGTLIPRKTPGRPDNLTIVDKQALENERMNGSATIVAPQR